MKHALDARRWAETVSLFEEIVELSTAEQQERLQVIGASDPGMRHSIEELLAADSNADNALKPFDVALCSTPDAHRDTSLDADPLKLVGRSVSHFRVIEALAFGGMGAVYRAEDTQLKREIALKFPLPTHYFERSARERFLHEARIIGALDHPNLCGIHEAGETADGHLFLAMPLYAGETLKARIVRAGAFPIDEAIAIAHQIALGLSVAHRAGIVHRDLKPANVMLLPDGTVKILDFGLAKARDLTITASRARLGTVAYMAPEQIQGQAVDARADLWALGVVLYEMLTGARPFDGDLDITVAHRVLHDSPAPPSALRPDVPAAAEAIVQRLLRKRVSERHASMDDLVSDLARVRDEPRRRRRAGRGGWGGIRTRALLPLITLIAAATAGSTLLMSRRDTAAGALPRTVAVLPFDSEGENSRHLAVGLSDVIREELSRLGSVIVPTYGAVVRHARQENELAGVADVLGATAVVRGRVRREDDRIEFAVELLDPATKRTLWTKRYDGSSADIAAMQHDATAAIVDRLGIRLTEDERARIAHPPTTHPQAFELYFRGREVELSIAAAEGLTPLPIDSVREAQALYSRARELDPSFAMAHARLGYVLMLGASFDTTRARREQALLEAETALRLQPGLAAAHVAIASYWSYGGVDPEKSIERLKLGLAELPNSAALHSSLAYRYANLGRMAEAIEEFEQAARLDPGDPNVHFRAALFYLRARRNEEAIRAFDRSIAIAPDYHLVKLIKGHTYMRAAGAVDTMAAIMSSIPAEWDPTGQATYARYSVLRVQRRPNEALRMLDASRSELARDDLLYHPISLLRADIYADMGDRTRARAHYDAARALLEDSVAAYPRNASMRSSLALAYAGLDRREDAIREAHQAMELAPVAQRHPAATAFMGVAAEVLGQVGQLDEAFDLLELLFTMQAGRETSVPWLRLWPGFDPLRSDPRFERLLNRFATS